MTYKELYELAGRVGDYKLRRKIEALILSYTVLWNDQVGGQL